MSFLNVNRHLCTNSALFGDLILPTCLLHQVGHFVFANMQQLLKFYLHHQFLRTSTKQKEDLKVGGGQFLQQFNGFYFGIILVSLKVQFRCILMLLEEDFRHLWAM